MCSWKASKDGYASRIALDAAPEKQGVASLCVTGGHAKQHLFDPLSYATTIEGCSSQLVEGSEPLKLSLIHCLSQSIQLDHARHMTEVSYNHVQKLYLTLRIIDIKD